MQQILFYSDSLSWGIIPNTRRRLSYVERWPGAMERSTRGTPRKPKLGCPFLDAGKVVTTSTVDGVHLDADQHLVLAHALAQKVLSLLDGAPMEAR